MDIIQKSWKITTPPLKKLLSRTITHRLSQKLNKNLFEVVYEGFLDSHNPISEQPDVVIYSKQDYFKPVCAIEVCKASELLEMILIAKNNLQTHHLREFFIYVHESDTWYLINNSNTPEIISSYSSLFSIDLRDTIRMFPVASA